MRTRYDYSVAREIVCGPSKTDKSFIAESDVNNIMRRYRKTGFLVDPAVRASRVPQFGDFSNAPQDFMEAQERVLKARRSFAELPLKVRKRFDNDPVKLLDFLADPANAEEAIGLGLVKAPEPVAPAPEPAKEPADAQ